MLKIARLGLPLQIVRKGLEDLRAFGRRDTAEGVSEGLTAYGGQHHGHVMQRYTGLLSAAHEGRHLTVQRGYLWRAVVVERCVRGSSHRRVSGVSCWVLPRPSRDAGSAGRAGPAAEMRPGLLGL